MSIKVTASEHWAAAFIEDGTKSLVIYVAEIPELIIQLQAALEDIRITYNINKLLQQEGYDYRWT